MTRQLPPLTLPPAPTGKPVSIWILVVFLVGGLVGGTFAALNGNWLDVVLAAILVVGALIAFAGRFRKPTEVPYDPAQHRILLVEDDRAVREVTTTILTDAGYPVESAITGDEALELYGERAPELDLLLTDLRFPGLPGGELARIMLERNPRLCVLFVSGFIDAAEEDAWEGEPRVAFLGKPFRAQALADAVRALLTPLAT